MSMEPTLFAERLRHVSPWLYKLGAQAWIDYDYPRHLFIETTAMCDLACHYCPRERRASHMEFDLFKSIVDEATRFGPRSFSLHLFGEPLRYPRIIDSICYLRRANRHHTILLTTNGVRLNLFVDEVIAAGVNKIIWTWRPEAKLTVETKEKLRRWGHFMVRLIEEITPPEAMNEWGEWRPQERKRLHNYGGHITLSELVPSERGGFDNVANNGPRILPKRWPCYHLWLAPAVAWNGDITICCADPKHQEVLGRFPEMSIHEAWTSPRLQAIRQSHLRGEAKGLCEKCDVWQTYPDLWFSFQKRAGASASSTLAGKTASTPGDTFQEPGSPSLI